MNERVTGYSLTRAWFDWAFESNDVKPIHSAIYLWIVELNNRLGWKQSFGLPSNETMEGLGIGNKNTYLAALRQLAEWGFIEIIKESKNQYSSSVVSLCHVKNDTALHTALDTALIQQSTQHRHTIAHSTDTIDKQVNQETKKPRNQEHDICEGENFGFLEEEPSTDLVGETTEKIPPSSARPPLSLKAKVAEAGKFVEHPFEEDELFDKEKFRTLVEEKNPELDADYYYLAVCGWRDKYGKPPKRKVWASVVNQFLLNDHKKGQLQFKKKHPTETSNRNANPASTQYVKPTYEDVLAIVNERYFGKAE